MTASEPACLLHRLQLLEVLGYLLLALGALLMGIQLAANEPRIPDEVTPVVSQHPQSNEEPSLLSVQVDLNLNVGPELPH